MHEHCDICGEEFAILNVYYSGHQFLCENCRSCDFSQRDSFVSINETSFSAEMAAP
jgi:recombinational DNA repair protein (RecF pathway)